MTSFLKNVWSRTSAAQLVSAERALLDRIQSSHGKVLSRPVPIGHGHHINTIILGDPANPPLVLVHGYGAGVGFWFKNMAGLAAHHRVFAIDLLGFGRSSRPKPRFSHEDIAAAESFFVDSLEQWRKKVGLTNFHLLGHSFGGYISTVYAGKHPEHFQNTHLILASPFGVPEKIAPAVTDPALPPPDTSRSTIYKMIERLWGMNVTPASLVRTFGPMGPYLIRSLASARFRHLPKDEIEHIIDYLHHTWAASGSGEFALGALFAPMGWARNPLIHRLKQITAPTSFIYGEYDWMGWEVVDETIRQGNNPNLRSLHVLPGVGHQLFLEDPDGFNRTVSSIIAQPVQSQPVPAVIDVLPRVNADRRTANATGHSSYGVH